jgi:hypothetical protein
MWDFLGVQGELGVLAIPQRQQEVRENWKLLSPAGDQPGWNQEMLPPFCCDDDFTNA